MSAQHTPGPWAYNGATDIYSVDAGFTICELYREYLITGQAQANARLIAAAPELLEALEKLLRAFDRTGIKLASLSGKPTATDNARAAITKTKGGAES